MNSVLQQVEAAVEENWNIGLAKARAEARVKALLDLAVFCGALADPRERQDYREQLEALALDRLPAMAAYLAYLPAFPEGTAQAAVAQRFLDDLLGRDIP